MKIRLLFLLVLLSSTLLAQKIRRFSEDRTAFLAEVQEYLEEENDRLNVDDTLVPFINAFAEIYQTAALTPEEIEMVTKISNNFLKKRISDFESWRYFFRLIEHFERNEKEKEHLAFLRNLEEWSRKPARFTSDYLRTMYLSFYRQRLFDDGRVSWEVIGDAPSYGFEGEPYFDLNEVDLWGFYRNDSTLVERMSGRYYPQSYRLEAQGGTAFFSRAGLPPDSIYVELQSYKIQLDRSQFVADSATLFSKYYLNQPVVGAYEERLTSLNGDPNSAVFPRFRSYRTDILIPDMFPDARFKGGFSVVGGDFYGSANEKGLATLEFDYKDTLLIRIRTERLAIRSDKIYSDEVEATIYLQKDSIYHPRLTMRYLPELDKFTLLRKDEGMGAAPFSDSYHNVDVRFDVLDWTIGGPRFQLTNLNQGGAAEPVVFESNNYFRSKRFSAIEGFSRRNPLVTLRNLVEAQGGNRNFTTEDIAYHMAMDQSNAHIFLMNMAILGFVEYRVDDREAIILDKVFNYIYNMRRVRDFDVIQFVSRVEEGSNATLSLEDYSMDIEGIEQIALSDSQRVGLFPYGNRISLEKGLDFTFEGQIKAGRFNFWGHDFEFSYDSFMINMTDIDSMRFKVMSFEDNSVGQRYLVDVKTVLQDLKGELLIDKPDNKSGKTYYSEYPIFRAANESYIYYDKPSIYGGVYNREEFFVSLEPFEIDSLDNTTTSGLSFDGRFTSAGIFPEMQQRITVQEDYSLGFSTETPSEGLDAYGKGTFTSALSLSNKGLVGNGRIDYLNSYATSDKFLFFPDSTNGQAHQYEIAEKTGGVGSNPHVVGDEVALHWEPYNDVLYTRSQETPFAMYDEIGMVGTGRLAHSPQGLNGKGLMQFLNAETRSKDYTFESTKLRSPELAFRVRANENADWGFAMQRAEGEVDFTKERGYFTLKDPTAYFKFPANQYITYMNYARWIIPEKALDLEKTGGGDGLAEMISVHPHQDSLRFLAERTKFYLEESLLESFQVPEINVADASIFPDTGYVAIDSAADMRTLTNAAITATRVNQWHQFYGSTVDVISRKKYIGEGDYEYLDQDGTPWPIHFSEIKADTGTTVGFAQIKEKDAFYMSPYFAYYGNVRLKANRRELAFRGHTHIESDCEAVSTNWFEFESLIDPSNILIDLPEVDPDDKTKTLANGVFLDTDTITGYAAFLSSEVSPADKQMFFANGVLYYDESAMSYVVTEMERVRDASAPHNILYFKNIDCTMQGQGEMSLGDNKNQLQVSSYGTIDYDLETDDMQLELSLGLDFPFDRQLQERMAQLLQMGAGSGVDYSSTAFTTAVDYQMEAEEAGEFMADIQDYGAPEELPDELQHTILLGGVTMNWTPESISFLSQGKIGVASFGEEMANIQVDGYFEIQRKRRGDEIYLYLEVDRSTFIYIEYKRGMMGIYSSDEALMTRLKTLELDERRTEESGKRPFTYSVSTKGKLNRFIRRFEQFED